MQQLTDMFKNSQTNGQLRAYLAGILYNISNNRTYRDTLNLIFPFLCSCLEWNGLNELMKSEKHFAQMVLDRQNKSLPPDSQTYSAEINNWWQCIKAQQFCLELLTNICSSIFDFSLITNTIRRRWRRCESPTRSYPTRHVIIYPIQGFGYWNRN